jgi:hypothetical protein
VQQTVQGELRAANGSEGAQSEPVAALGDTEAADDTGVPRRVGELQTECFLGRETVALAIFAQRIRCARTPPRISSDTSKSLVPYSRLPEPMFGG